MPKPESTDSRHKPPSTESTLDIAYLLYSEAAFVVVRTGRPNSKGSYQMDWNVLIPNEIVYKELDSLPADMRGRFARISELIAEFGPMRAGASHVRHIQGPLWEMRRRGRDGISRAFCVVCEERRQVVVRVFIKKTRKTPPREIRLALTRARDLRDSE